jgi:hypothetical protein
MSCYRNHEPEPERPERLEGPELGALCRMRSKSDWLNDRVVKVVARSYVWSPEYHRPDGYHGYRRYDWSVIEYTAAGSRVVVNDVDLIPLQVGDPL